MERRITAYPAYRIVLAYVVFASLWIWLSDRLLARLDPDPTSFWGTYKGLAFVAITAVLLLALLRRTLDRMHAAQAALAQSEERFRLLVTEVRDYAIFLLDPHGCVMTWSAGAEHLTGFREAEILGKHLSGFYLPEEVQAGKPAQALQAAAEAGRCTDEGWRVRKDGSRFWARTVLTALRDEQGALWAFAKVTYDDTARRQAEDALKESEAKLRALFAAMTDVILVLDSEGRYLEIAPTNPNLLYRPAPELLGRRLHEVFPAEEADLFLSEVRRALADGQPVQLEYRLNIGGRPVWFAATVSPLRPGAVLWVARDITARKEAETLLRQQTERLQEQAELLDLAQIFVQDMDHRVVLWNTGTERLYGFTRDEALGQVSHQLLRTEFPESLAKILEELDRAGRWEGEVHHTTRDGRRIAVASLWVLHHDAAGRSSHILQVNSDITGLKEAERTLHELSGRLLRLQDDERRRIARELHDTTSQNLAALAMNLSLLRHALPKPEAKVDRILSDCASLANRCTQEIRTLSYLLHPPALDMMGLPGALREYVDGFGRRSGITIDFTAPEDFGRLPAAVETALFRVVQEALGNVHRHSGSHTARVCLRRPGHDVAVEITDMGRGIPPQKLTSFNEGLAVLGVGLAGMRERLHQLGGRLEIESSASGTQVRATVPIETGPLAKAE